MVQKIKKAILFSCGFLSLILGGIGLLLPIVPTTPFILLAAFFFSMSSEKFYHRLRNDKYFGSAIRDWEARGAISPRNKIFATFVLILLVVMPNVWVEIPGWVLVLNGFIVIAVLIFLWTRPS